jgi:hypothetical protein
LAELTTVLEQERGSELALELALDPGPVQRH